MWRGVAQLIFSDRMEWLPYIAFALLVVAIPVVAMRRRHNGQTRLFRMRVEHVFVIRAAEGEAIEWVAVVGIVGSGVVRPGDDVVIQSSSGSVRATVVKLDHPKMQLKEAAYGQDVGLMFKQLDPQSVHRGDQIISAQWNDG